MQFIPGTMGRVPAMLDTYYRSKPGALAPATLHSRQQRALHFVRNDVLAYAQKEHEGIVGRPYIDEEAIDQDVDDAERILASIPTLHPRDVKGTLNSM